jgi:hypothetical protein
MTGDLPPTPNDNNNSNNGWKTQTYLFGGLFGLMVGLMAAYFYARASEEHTPDRPTRIKTMDALKLGVSMLSLVRQITDLGADGGKK